MTATASAAPSATRPAAAAQAGQARGVRQSQGASFDDAFLALLLGAADGPPELPIAPAEPPPGEPAPLDATTDETATALEGVATAEAFPLPDLAAPWLALRDSLVPPPAAPLAPDADGGTEAQPGLHRGKLR